MEHGKTTAESIAGRSQEVIEGLSKAVKGQEEHLRLLWTALLTGGHVLVEGVPGLGKTLMVRALGAVMKASFSRVQFTPDLMPADVMGTQVFDSQSNEFIFKKGPLFTQVLLADEINRTPPKTQAALLEAMEEGQVSVDGQSLPLPSPFFVVATQNPVEYEGTYPLPEAQLDRFAMKLLIEYPGEEEEVAILRNHGLQSPDKALIAMITPEEIIAFREHIASIHAEESILRYIASIVRQTRDHPQVMLGASPRAGINLLKLARGIAAIEGREYVIPDDVKGLVGPILRHRLVLNPDVELEGMNADDLIREIVGSVTIPR